MKIAGEYLFEQPRDLVWEAILDPEVLSNTLPGCEDLQKTGHNEYEGKLKMKVGPVQGVFSGEVQITDPDPPKSYNLKLKGKGAPGFVNGDGRLELVEQDGGTLLRYDIDAQVGGRIAAVGQRLLESSAKVITKQGLEGLKRQLDMRADSTSGTGPASGEGADSKDGEASGSNPSEPDLSATATGNLGRQDDSSALRAGEAQTVALNYDPIQATSQAELAREVAKGVASDLVPRGARPWLALALLFLIGAIDAMVLRFSG